jgi:hypothetical protein
VEDLVQLLGLRVKDKVTGFSGVVTSVCMDLYGCKQALLHPGMDKDGKLLEQGWFDQNRIEIINKKPVMLPPAATTVKGPADKPRYPAA